MIRQPLGRTTVLPPGPRGSRLVGNLQAFEANRLQFLTDFRDHYGPIASFDSRTAVISDPVLADRVLRAPQGGFGIDQNFLGHRLSHDQALEVLQARPLLNPGLRSSMVEPLADQIQQATVRAFGLEQGDQQRGEFADPLVCAENIVAPVVAHHYFGADGSAVTPHVAGLLDALEVTIGNVLAFPPAWRSPTQRRIERRHDRLHRVISELLHRRLRSTESDVAALVVAGGAEEHGIPRLADLLIGALLAAQRVPAAAVSWTLMLLADHAEVQDGLRLEAQQHHDDLANGAAQPATAYPNALAAVLESLRLYPPTWLLTRTATKPVDLGGFSFPTGHTFLISPYVLHRDEQHFAAANSYRPARWLRSQPPTTVYLPFGRGRHRCPGTDLATTCLVSILLTLVQRGRIARSGNVVPDSRATLRPTGLRIAVTPHTHDAAHRAS